MRHDCSRKSFLKRSIALLAIAVLAATLARADETRLVRLAGTPEQIGTIWGETNKELIASDMEATYLKPAADKGISKDALIARSDAFVRIASEIAPHWLEEARAIARAAGVDESLYLAFVDGQSRNRFLHECTSYAVSRDGTILFHKNRDNVDRPQATAIVESSLKGISKFIGVSDAGWISCSMMVNDKGLAGSSDYPADRKKDSSTLVLKPAEPQYRGLMAGTILRHIAERAATCAEALAIIEDFVAKGYYAGGDINASHWLFVDRNEVILEVCNNARHVVSQVHTQKVYFSRLNNSPAAKRLRESVDPIDFHLFHNLSRDPSICFKSSISGMTVEIDPQHPEWFTCAWIALPARTVAFPLLMGQGRTPECLFDGTAYRLGKKHSRPSSQFEELEQTMRADKERLKEELAASIAAGNPDQAHREALEQWSDTQTRKLLKVLEHVDGITVGKQ